MFPCIGAFARAHTARDQVDCAQGGGLVLALKPLAACPASPNLRANAIPHSND